MNIMVKKPMELFKFHNKNVVYLAYVGKYEDKDTYKYGVTSNIYQRVLCQHVKQFDTFDLCWVKPTYNTLQAEDLFEKELKFHGLHKSIPIKNKRQTELFQTTDAFTYKKVQRLYSRISTHVDKDIFTTNMKQSMKQSKKQ